MSTTRGADLLVESSKQKEEEQRKWEAKQKLERKNLEAELLSVQVSFKELHSRYEDLKTIQETYRKVCSCFHVFPFLNEI